MSESVLIPHLADAMVRVTEKAAIAAEALAGRGDEKAADAAAVDAMRTAFNAVDFQQQISVVVVRFTIQSDQVVRGDSDATRLLR